MSLKDKIASKSELLDVIGTSTFMSIERNLLQKLGNLSDGTITRKVHWWAVREQRRLDTNTYETTDALIKVNEHCPSMFAHVSSEDRSMVAYTPDNRYGQEDRQLRITLGKFLARMLPMASDDYIRDLAAWHSAELSDDVEWIEGEEISKTYKKDTSTGACMSAKSFATQPTLSYAAAGIKMAVLRREDGTLNARAMVYEHGNKKVYIRAYGSPLLKKRLERLGYSAGSWEGVKFNTIFLDYENRSIKKDAALEQADDNGGIFKVVTPYLDSFNGTCTNRGSSLALMDYELICIPEGQQRKLQDMGYVLKIPSTTGYVELKNLDTSEFKVVDHFTGAQLNRLTTLCAKLAVRNEDGTFSFVWYNPETLSEEVGSTLHKCTHAANRTTEYVYTAKENTFLHNSYQYSLDNEATRLHFGYKKLSPKYYPDDNAWYRDWVNIDDSETSDFIHTIKKEDAVVILGKDGMLRKRFKGSVVKGMTMLKKSGAHKGYAEEGVVVKRTPSGAKVAFGYTEGLAYTYNGVDYGRNIKSVDSVMGFSIMASKGAAYRDDPLFNTYCETVFETKYAELLDTWDGSYFQMLRARFRNNYTYIIPRSTHTKQNRSTHLSSVLAYNPSADYLIEVCEQVMDCTYIDKWDKLFAKRIHSALVEATAEEAVVHTSDMATIINASSEERFALAA